MAIGTDYSTPVIVNGYACKNCTDVGNARKHVDPDHPRSGPYGINAADDPTVKPTLVQPVRFGGALTKLNETVTQAASDPAPASGAQLDISV